MATNMADQLKQVFTTPDGKQFDTKAEAMDYLRKPLIIAALMAITNNNQQLAELLYEHREFLEDTFAVGTITRVTKSERNQLKKALEAVKASGNKAFAFISDNADAILETFRWPTVKRMEPEEKAQAIRLSLLNVTENNEKLVDWIIAAKDKIFECYEAGKVKQTVAPKASEGLTYYRYMKAADKAIASLKTVEGKVDPSLTDQALQAKVDIEAAKTAGNLVAAEAAFSVVEGILAVIEKVKADEKAAEVAAEAAQQ